MLKLNKELMEENFISSSKRGIEVAPIENLQLELQAEED
jgi:hypothetical protein